MCMVIARQGAWQEFKRPVFLGKRFSVGLDQII